MSSSGQTTHGHAQRGAISKTYKIWAGMLARCRTPSATGYENYGGAGITVCKSWTEFANFLADMGEAPADHSIDRVDNAKGYSLENCRWATRKQQNENKRSSRLIEFNGETLNLSIWAKRLGLNHASLHERLSKWPLERALTEPKR